MIKSEQSKIVSSFLWVLKFDFNINRTSRSDNLVDLFSSSFQFLVTVSSYKFDIWWPSLGTNILECPSKSVHRTATSINILLIGVSDKLCLQWSVVLLRRYNVNILIRSHRSREICILSHEMSWCFAWMSDLEHWVWRLNSYLTLFTKIVIWSDRALESNTFNWIGIAPIANSFGVNHSGLLSLSGFQKLDQKFLILRGAAFGHFVAQNFLKVLHESVVNSSSSIALFARKAFFVNHFSIAFEALW